MARPQSSEKRDAILDAATEGVASRGVEAPTASIAKAAGVAEGTLFTYFATKDALLNALYLKIKGEVAEAVLEGVDDSSDPVAKLKLIWENYLRWGLANTAKRRAMAQLAVSGRLTDETKDVASNAFREVDVLLSHFTGDAFDEASEYAGAVIASLAESTIEFISSHPEKSQSIQAASLSIIIRAMAWQPDQSGN